MLSWCQAKELPKTILSKPIGHRCNGGMGSEAWNSVRNLPHQSDQSAHVNLAIFSINTNLRQAVVPCWGTVHFWTSSSSLRTHQYWDWLLGPDLWPDRSLSWSAGWEKKHQEKYMYRCHRLMYAYSLHCNSHVASLLLDVWSHAWFLFAAQGVAAISIGHRGRTLLLRITCWRLWAKVLKVARGFRRQHDVLSKKAMAIVQNSQNGLLG